MLETSRWVSRAETAQAAQRKEERQRTLAQLKANGLSFAEPGTPWVSSWFSAKPTRGFPKKTRGGLFKLEDPPLFCKGNLKDKISSLRNPYIFFGVLHGRLGSPP